MDKQHMFNDLIYFGYLHYALFKPHDQLSGADDH